MIRFIKSLLPLPFLPPSSSSVFFSFLPQCWDVGSTLSSLLLRSDKDSYQQLQTWTVLTEQSLKWRTLLLTASSRLPQKFGMTQKSWKSRKSSENSYHNLFVSNGCVLLRIFHGILVNSNKEKGLADKYSNKGNYSE